VIWFYLKHVILFVINFLIKFRFNITNCGYSVNTFNICSTYLLFIIVYYVFAIAIFRSICRIRTSNLKQCIRRSHIKQTVKNICKYVTPLFERLRMCTVLVSYPDCITLCQVTMSNAHFTNGVIYSVTLSFQVWSEVKRSWVFVLYLAFSVTTQRADMLFNVSSHMPASRIGRRLLLIFAQWLYRAPYLLIIYFLF